MKRKGASAAGQGANWGGEAAADSTKKAKKGRPLVGVEPEEQSGVAALQPVSEKSKKKKLGRKEREKLKLKAAKAQAQADEEAGRIAAGGIPTAAGELGTQKTDKKKRYTVFVGNLPYDATQQDVFKHFDNFLREMVLDVRMQHDRGTGEFRGTCFVDLKDPISLSKAYKLHHSKIMDRQINVEPTVGGGGKGENRRRKMEEKKREWSKLRKKRITKEVENPKTKKSRGIGAQKRSALAQKKAAARNGRKSGGGGVGKGRRHGGDLADTREEN